MHRHVRAAAFPSPPAREVPDGREAVEDKRESPWVDGERGVGRTEGFVGARSRGKVRRETHSSSRPPPRTPHSELAREKRRGCCIFWTCARQLAARDARCENNALYGMNKRTRRADAVGIDPLV